MFKLVDRDAIEVNGLPIKLPCTIARDLDHNPYILEHSGLILVCFYPHTLADDQSIDKSVDMERNIWAFDSAGNLVWKVSPPTTRPYSCNPYSSVFVRDGKVVA